MAQDSDDNVVTLEGDATPFEQMLDRAQQKAAGWGDKITSLLDKVGGKANERIKSLASYTENLVEGQLSSVDIGSTLGNTLGSAVGTFLGGPLGTMIGGKLGSVIGGELASAVDFGPITAGLSGVLGGYAQIGDRARETWAASKEDGVDTFTRIKEAFGDIGSKDFWDLLVKGSPEAASKFAEAFKTSFQEIEDFGARSLYRVQSFIDETWASVRGPLAAVADILQGVAVRLGLVDDSTKSWGESILSIQDVGEKVIGALGYGFGFLEGLLKKVGGYVGEYVLVPYLKVMHEVYSFINDLAILGSELPGILGEAFKKMNQVLDKGLDNSKASIEALQKLSKDAQSTDIWATAGQRQGQAVGWMKSGKEGAEALDLERWMDKLWADAAAASVQPLANMNPAQATTDHTSAMLRDSREANNAILRATMGTGNNNPAERQAKAMEETVSNTDKIEAHLAKLVELAEDDEGYDAV